MTCTDKQVRLLMKERTKGRTQQQAAVKANISSRKTARKYERLGKLPGELKKPREYRTREDPFVDDWELIAAKLQLAPELEAGTLFDWLCEEKPGKYKEGQRRTLQRRVADWRALNREQDAVLEQMHRPGEAIQTDGTWLSKLGVTVNGSPFKHILIHCVLPYSNWEWGAIAQSESLLALQRGLQRSLLKLGAAPTYHQTDNGSAVTHPLAGQSKGKRAYNPDYEALLAHFGLKPRRTAVRSPEQNGDVESSNGGLKRALEQQLLLRGSRDFASLADYEAFVEGVMTRRNQARQTRLTEELAVMTPLKVKPLAPYQAVRVKVMRGSLIRVQNNVYSVPTHLIGQEVEVRIYEWHLEVYYRQTQVEHLPRLVGQNKQEINYRHLVKSLLHKPGGFREYRYRDALFPQLIFRQAWEQLQGWYSPRKADLTYLRVLKLAAFTLECDVADALTVLTAEKKRWDETDVERLIRVPQTQVPALLPLVVNLAAYDRLLQAVA